MAHRALISTSWSECVWDFAKRQKDLQKPTSSEDLWLVLQDVCNKIPAELLQKLFASIGFIAVLKAKGGHQILI